MRVPSALTQTPRLRAAATRAAASGASGASVKTTMLVCTVPRSSDDPRAAGEAFREQAGVGMVLAQAAPGGARARAGAAAAKMPTWRIAPPSMRRWRSAARDELARAGQQRPARRAQALGERHRDQVEGRGEPVDAGPVATAAFQSPRAVEKRRDAALAGGGADALDFVLGEDDAAGAVVRVLDLDQRGRRIDAVVARLDRGDELRRAEDAARCRSR